MFIMNRVLPLVFYCVLLSAFIVPQYTEYMNMQGISSITNKNKGHVFDRWQWRSFCFLRV